MFSFLPSGYTFRNKEKCPGYLDDVADTCCTWNVLTFAMFDGGGGAGLTGALTAFQSEQPTCYKNKFYLIAKKKERLPHHLTIEFSATWVKNI